MSTKIDQFYDVRKLIDKLPIPGGNHPTEITCAQASSSEIYIGCSNGELLRYALQVDNANKLDSYSLISRQSVPGDKPVLEIILLPSINRALIRSDQTTHFYTLPALDPIPSQSIKTIKNTFAIAVDYIALKRPPSSTSTKSIPPVDFCVIKRAAIAMYQLRETLVYLKEIPLPPGVILARRIGPTLLIADRETYSVINLQKASLQELIPVSQSPDPNDELKIPHIVVIGEREFLLCSWTGVGSMGVFVDDSGSPIRGTINWPSHPISISIDYPHITALLSNGTIEVHDMDSPGINLVQVISSPEEHEAVQRKALVTCLESMQVPTTSSARMGMVSVPLVR